MTRPVPWSPREVPTVWLDYVTGRGVTDPGATVTPRVTGRRKNPSLGDLLDTAHALGAERIMLTGAVPANSPNRQHWLYVKTPGWSVSPRGHWLSQPATGRFVNNHSGKKLEVRTVEEWFGTNDLSPAEAREAWQLTAEIVHQAVDREAKLMLSPAATGQHIWARSLPRNLDPEQVPADVAALIHASAGQHRQQHLTTGRDFCSCGACVPFVDVEQTPTIGRFTYVDGRFMYGALLRELGVGGTYLSRQAASDLLEHEPYARARLKVRFTVPAGWAHVGLLGVQHDDLSDGWHYPNRPGSVHETWADASEVHLAVSQGWLIEPVEGILHRKTKVADTFGERLVRARALTANAPATSEAVRRGVAAALRAMLIQTIGAWASRGRDRSFVTDNPLEVPVEHQASIQRHGDLYVWKVSGSVDEVYSGSNSAWYRPEIAAQVWGRGRARVLSCPTGVEGVNGGALSVDPTTLLGINGDAIYTTDLPTWSLPTAAGGGDDGRVGRMRLQGLLEGSIATPTGTAERNKLRARAEQAGIESIAR